MVFLRFPLTSLEVVLAKDPQQKVKLELWGCLNHDLQSVAFVVVAFVDLLSSASFVASLSLVRVFHLEQLFPPFHLCFGVDSFSYPVSLSCLVAFVVDLYLVVV